MSEAIHSFETIKSVKHEKLSAIICLPWCLTGQCNKRQKMPYNITFSLNMIKMLTLPTSVKYLLFKY